MKAGLVSREHFTVDGTLIEAWASLKSFKRKDGKSAPQGPPDDPGNPSVNFHGEKRSNETHQSTTDPESQLARKGRGKEAKLCFSGHLLMENRNGLCVDVRIAEANPSSEWRTAIAMLEEQRRRGLHPTTVGADKAYDVTAFIEAMREQGIAPHVAQNISRARGSKIDARTTRHPGYAVSQRKRKLVEEIFGWGKTIGGLRKTRYKGKARTGMWAYIAGAAYNLTRLVRLLPEPA
jgi:hypothetical protein